MSLNISSSPHIRSKATTSRIMLDVIISLMPCVVAATVIFGVRSLLLILTSVAVCLLCEYLSCLIMKRKNTLSDLSAVVTGLLFALSLPVGTSLYVVALGAAFAIVICKQVFGGIGCNIVNPALGGRAFTVVSFAALLTECNPVTVDGITGATPLSDGFGTTLTLPQLLLGNYGGAIGETCKIAVLAGFIYLLIRRVISVRIPLCMMAGAAVICLLTGDDVLYTLLTGGLLFGAVFMATDYVTTPLHPVGQVIFGFGCGVLTMVIRRYATYPEGTMFAILLMNIATPLIDRINYPVFGAKSKKEIT